MYPRWQFHRSPDDISVQDVTFIIIRSSGGIGAQYSYEIYNVYADFVVYWVFLLYLVRVCVRARAHAPQMPIIIVATSGC